MNKVLSIKINIISVESVQGKHGKVVMLSFDGEADSALFQGKVLPGAVDTQKFSEQTQKLLSARYMLKGKDFKGKDCKIFIENEGIDNFSGEIKTKPLIYTDSEALEFLENAELFGLLENEGNQLYVNFYNEEEK